MVDVGPDFRQQALKYKINNLDCLILTHAHFDHVAGIDDLRIYNRKQKKPIDCFLLKETFDEIKIKYDHLFKENQNGHTQSAKFNFHILNSRNKTFKYNDTFFNYFSFFQDSKKVLGIRLKKFAYVTDIKRYDDQILNDLKDLDILVLSCLKKDFSDVHFNLKEAVQFIKKVNPKITYLIHLAHEIDYFGFLPENVKNIKLAYDGLKLKF